MADGNDDRKRALGSAPTTPAPEGTKSKLELAAGSTLDMPQPPQDSDFSAGAVLGRFVLNRRLGRGGMGDVYAGEDVDLGRPVAIKVVRADTDHPAYHARLMREAQALARLEHPNVVRVYEVGSDHGRLFIAMELVDGSTLTTWLAQIRSWQEILAMFVQVGVGLAAVHHAGIVHRDFKPDNVLIDRDGKARVADFGLARTTRDDASPMGQPLTRTGVMMGTPGYMAPEQQFGADVDARADQYSYCVALREALGGRPVDEARWSLVPKALRDAVARGLSYDPDERFASMDQLLAALRGASSVRDQRWLVALLVLAVLGAVAGIVAYVSARRDEPVAEHTTTPSPGDAAVASAQVDARAGDAMLIVRGEVADAGLVRDEIDVAPVDAAVHAPHDAGASHPPLHARDTVHDAAEHVAQAPAPAPGPVAIVAVPGDAGAPQLTVIAPHSQGWAVAQVNDPGHLAVVRTAIRDLGYDGVDLGKLADLEREAKIDAEGVGVDAGIAQVKLGLVARRNGDCGAAQRLFDAATQQIKPNDGDENAQGWRAKAAFGKAMCLLGSGHAEDAQSAINFAWVHGNRDEITVSLGFIAYERGEKDTAYAHLLGAERKQNARVQAALKAWLDGLGLSLR